MKPVEIKKNIFWVGAVDWNIKNFHGHTYTTKRGTTYNAYLILDEKIALIDTVYGPFTDELISNIKEVVPPDKIDYIIANHVETDHSGALPELIKLAPSAKIFGTAKCKEGLLKHYHTDLNFQPVKNLEKLSLGRRSLTFIEAPMLHWPDSMFTYCQEEKLLLPNDAFGQHYATSERFDDEVDNAILMEEAEKYYANILWPFSSLISKKIQEIVKLNIPIDMIAPSHGIIWRKDPKQIINSYVNWASNQPKRKVIIVYETMWGSTEKMARAILQGVVDSGISTKLYEITQSDRTEVIKEMLDAQGYIIGSSTHDNGMLTTIFGFLEFLKGLNPKNRIACAFGSFGWAGGAVKDIEEMLSKAQIQIAQPALTQQYAPTESELQACYEYGKSFAAKLK